MSIDELRNYFKDDNRHVDYSSIEIDGIDHRDCPDYVDAFVCNALWDNGEELNELELDILNEDRDLVYDKVWEYIL